MARLPIARFVLPGDDLVPSFDVFIAGKNAGKGTALFDAIRPLIAGVTYEEDEEMATVFELTVINQPETKPQQRVNWNAVVDSKAFQEGNAIDLFMGYGGVKQYMGRVELVKWLPKFPASGPGTFVVKGFDGRHRMMKGNQHIVKQTKKVTETPVVKTIFAALPTIFDPGLRIRTVTVFGESRIRRTSYSGMPDEEIVRKIARKYGYRTDVDATEIKKRVSTVKKVTEVPGVATVFGRLPARKVETDIKVARKVFPTRPHPSDMSDWAFLQKLAKINRFDLWVDFDLDKKQWVIHFKKRQDAGSAVYLFTYNGRDGSLIEAEPDFSIQEQPTDVEVLFYDKRLHKVQRTIISDLNPNENVNFTSARQGNFEAKKTMTKGARVRFSAFGQTIEALANKPFRSKKDAETFVKHWLAERERDFVVLKGKVIGIETLRPRQIHQFEGMSKRLDGFYRFTQTKHVQVPGSLYVVEFVATKVLSQEVARRKATTKITTTKTTRQA